MTVMEVGRICIKRRGREAGKKVVIVDHKKGFAVVDGLNVKRKECNAKHLFPTKEKINVKKGASHDEVIKALK